MPVQTAQERLFLVDVDPVIVHIFAAGTKTDRAEAERIAAHIIAIHDLECIELGMIGAPEFCVRHIELLNSGSTFILVKREAAVRIRIHHRQ